MKTVFSDRHRGHHGAGELAGGRFVPCYESPARAERVLAAVREVDLGEVVAPDDCGSERMLAVHETDYVRFLEAAYDQWLAAGRDGDALPLSWPARGMRDVVPASIDGKLGRYAFASDTPITAGTWDAVRASVDVAVTAQRLVAAGEPAAFALCRPPGHHAGTDFYGGYCFVNNAAVVAQSFIDGGAERVAVLDVDYHHGNGTQQIFYGRRDVVTVSIHADPTHGFPFYLGYADEIGAGDGEGFNMNLPLPHGTAWSAYRPVLDAALARLRSFRPAALVVSLGLDTYREDPISHFALTTEDYDELGSALWLGVPTVFVLEGGYAIDQLGVNATRVLRAFDATGRR